MYQGLELIDWLHSGLSQIHFLSLGTLSRQYNYFGGRKILVAQNQLK